MLLPPTGSELALLNVSRSHFFSRDFAPGLTKAAFPRCVSSGSWVPTDGPVDLMMTSSELCFFLWNFSGLTWASSLERFPCRTDFSPENHVFSLYLHFNDCSCLKFRFLLEVLTLAKILPDFMVILVATIFGEQNLA